MAFFLILLILYVVHFGQNVYNNKYKELTVKVGEKWYRLIKSFMNTLLKIQVDKENVEGKS